MNWKNPDLRRFIEDFLIKDRYLRKILGNLEAADFPFENFIGPVARAMSWSLADIEVLNQGSFLGNSPGEMLDSEGEDIRASVEVFLEDEGYSQVLVALGHVSSRLDLNLGQPELTEVARLAFYDLCLAVVADLYDWPDASYVPRLSHSLLAPSERETLPEPHRTVSAQATAEASRVHRDLEGLPVSRDSNFNEWKSIRKRSISATDATKLLKKNGLASIQQTQLVRAKTEDVEEVHFASFDLGNEREPEIAIWVAGQYVGEMFEPSDVLFRAENPRHVATPDMVGVAEICEIKVSTKTLKEIRSKYLDQMQWQMYVLDKPRALFVVENRFSQEKETEWIERDDARIRNLIVSADLVLLRVDFIISNQEFETPTSLVEEDGEEDDPDDSFGMAEEDGRSYLPWSDPAPSSREERPEPQTLSWEENQEILNLYRRGRTIESTSNALEIETNDVVAALGRIIFSLDEPLVNEEVPHFGEVWQDTHVARLGLLYRSGITVPDIAEELGRDLLGVLYRIFTGFNPVIPLEVVFEYDLDADL